MLCPQEHKMIFKDKVFIVMEKHKVVHMGFWNISPVFLTVEQLLVRFEIHSFPFITTTSETKKKLLCSVDAHAYEN